MPTPFFDLGLASLRRGARAASAEYDCLEPRSQEGLESQVRSRPESFLNGEAALGVTKIDETR